MRKLFVVPMLLLCAASAFCSEGDRQFWSNRYDNIRKMLNDRDIQGFQQLLADKYTANDRGKHYSRSDLIKYVLEPIARANLAYSEVHVTSSKKKGDGYLVGYDWKYQLVYDDPKKGRYKVHGHETGTDTWQKLNGNWLMVHTDIKSSTMSSRKR